MKTVAQFYKPEEAHLARMRLGSEGIEAFLRDENTIQMDWFYSNAIGGVRLEVFDEDLEKAREILASEKKTDSPSACPACPACGSPATEPDETRRRLSFLSILLLNLPLPVPHNRFRCTECAHRWKEGKTGTRSDESPAGA